MSLTVIYELRKLGVKVSGNKVYLFREAAPPFKVPSGIISKAER